MKLSVFHENDSVLLVGEGNFSFAASLVKHNLPISIIATCYESSVTKASVIKNLDFLHANGVTTLLGVDGTKLAENPIICAKQFDKIIFNFPHIGGKMRIDKNRVLLMRFFASAEKSLKSNGLVLVTLCNGQGGTIVDSPGRHWNDSWKIVEMAAYGNFVLISVEPFCISHFQDYTSTGYRSLDKEFNVQNSLTHFFKKVEPPSPADLVPFVQLDSSTFPTDQNQVTYRNILPENFIDKLFFSLYFHTFHTTFCVSPEFKEIELYTILYNFAGRIVDNVEFVRSYRFPGTDKFSRTYRISYRSNDLPLYRERIIYIHENMIPKILEEHLNVVVTR